MVEQPSILLVEDEVLQGIALQDALEHAGFAVLLAQSGDAALPHLEDEGLACLVTDIRLGPGIGGWELARTAREKNSTQPVVYMSGDSAADWVSRGMPNSIMLAKPFATGQLVTAVATLVNGVPPA